MENVMDAFAYNSSDPPDDCELRRNELGQVRQAGLRRCVGNDLRSVRQGDRAGTSPPAPTPAPAPAPAPVYAPTGGGGGEAPAAQDYTDPLAAAMASGLESAFDAPTPDSYDVMPFTAPSGAGALASVLSEPAPATYDVMPFTPTYTYQDPYKYQASSRSSFANSVLARGRLRVSE